MLKTLLQRRSGGLGSTGNKNRARIARAVSRKNHEGLAAPLRGPCRNDTNGGSARYDGRAFPPLRIEPARHGAVNDTIRDLGACVPPCQHRSNAYLSDFRPIFNVMSSSQPQSEDIDQPCDSVAAGRSLRRMSRPLVAFRHFGAPHPSSSRYTPNFGVAPVQAEVKPSRSGYRVVSGNRGHPKTIVTGTCTH